MATLHLYSGTRSAPLTFEPTESAHFLADAQEAAEKLLGSALTGPALEAFRENVGRWMQQGYEGHFSLSKALHGAPAGKTVSLIDVRTVGHEVELGTLSLLKTGIAYGQELAATDEKSTRLELVSGTVTPKTTDWPLMKITVDGVSDKLPDKGHVEVVFGPVDLSNRRELENRARATALFSRAMTESAFYGTPRTDRRPELLSEAIGRYNKLLGSEKNASEMTKYRLTLAEDVKISSTGIPPPSVQTNVEIPLRKLGDVADTTVPRLFGANEGEDKAMFLAARAQAQHLVDTVLRPTAYRLHGGRYEEASIKLDKLRGTLTLALLYMGKVDQFDKEHWPFLPKTGAADIIRSALSLRDKLTLFEHTSTEVEREKLFDALVESALVVNAARGRPIGAESTLRENMRQQAAALFTPGTRSQRYGDESRCYGTLVDPSKQASGTGSSTGKKLPVGMDYTKKLLTSAEPKIVVELRRSDNGVNGMFGTGATYEPNRKTAKTPLGSTPTYDLLSRAAEHAPRGAAKIEKE